MAVDMKDVLIVVFDGAGARYFKLSAKGRLGLLKEVESGLHRKTSETVSDKQGRSFASAGGGIRSPYEPKHDPHKMEKHNFVHRIIKSSTMPTTGKSSSIWSSLPLNAAWESSGRSRPISCSGRCGERCPRSWPNCRPMSSKAVSSHSLSWRNRASGSPTPKFRRFPSAAPLDGFRGPAYLPGAKGWHSHGMSAASPLTKPIR
jgi:hypothetical protein